MKLALRIALFVVMLWLAPACVLATATVVRGYCGEACATFTCALLVAAWGFVCEFLIAGRPRWFLAAVLFVWVVVRYAIWIVVSFIADLGPVGFPGLGPNVLIEIIISVVAGVLAFCIVSSVRYDSHPQQGKAKVHPSQHPEQDEDEQRKGDRHQI